MTIPQLTSRHNPLLKTIRLVSSVSHRAPEGLVAAEGVRVLEEVERAGCALEAVLYSDNFGSNTREQKLLEAWKQKHVPLYRTEEKLLASVSGVQTSQGVIALVHIPEHSLENAELPKNALILCAYEVQDPGNLGTLIRTAAAAGAAMVCTIKGTVSARNPKAIRASAGVFFRLPIVEHIEWSDFQSFCHIREIGLYCADPRTGIPYTQADLASPCAILLGNEGGGMAEREVSGIQAIRIPMIDGIESLNVSIAGAVILFEAYRQRRNI